MMTKNKLGHLMQNRALHHVIGRSIGHLLQPLLGGVQDVTYSIGAETGGTTINVAIQAVDENADDVAQQVAFWLAILDAQNLNAFNTDNYTSIAVNTDGALVEVVADNLLFCMTEADGDIDIDFVITGAATSYLAFINAAGIPTFSDAITHA